MNVNSVNSTNFQARLDISKVKTNKARWENIAKVFKEETKLLPDERMSIVEHELDTSIIGSPDEWLPNIGKVEALILNQTLQELLEKNSDKSIVKKLIKLLNIGEIADARKEKAFEKFQSMGDKQSWISRDVFIEKRNLEYEKIEEAAINKANRDAFLKNFEVIV